MNEKKLRKMAELEAMETVLSDTNGLSVARILNAWDKGKHANVSVWEPFEYYTPRTLLEVWSGFAYQFEKFGKAVLND